MPYENSALPPALHAWPPFFQYLEGCRAEMIGGRGGEDGNESNHGCEGPFKTQFYHLPATRAWKLTTFLICKRAINQKLSLQVDSEQKVRLMSARAPCELKDP